VVVAHDSPDPRTCAPTDSAHGPRRGDRRARAEGGVHEEVSGGPLRAGGTHLTPAQEAKAEVYKEPASGRRAWLGRTSPWPLHGQGQAPHRPGHRA
jgi:hypothetical protein